MFFASPVEAQETDRSYQTRNKFLGKLTSEQADFGHRGLEAMLGVTRWC